MPDLRISSPIEMEKELRSKAMDLHERARGLWLYD